MSKRLSASDAKRLIDKQNACVIDIRDAGSFANGHITNAANVVGNAFTEFMAATEKNCHIIVCCHHGVMSISVSEILFSEGFENVYSLDGGFASWCRQYPKICAGLAI